MVLSKMRRTARETRVNAEERETPLNWAVTMALVTWETELLE